MAINYTALVDILYKWHQTLVNSESVRVMFIVYHV